MMHRNNMRFCCSVWTLNAIGRNVNVSFVAAILPVTVVDRLVMPVECTSARDMHGSGQE